MRRWTKLQREIYDLISPDIDFQLHCVAYPMNSQRGSTNMPRYWISIGKEIIWDYPKDFVRRDGTIRNYRGKVEHYPYSTSIDEITDLIREYIDTPTELLFDKHFESDKWGLTNILKAADRRIGTRRLDSLRRKVKNKAAKGIISQRLRSKESRTLPPQEETV